MKHESIVKWTAFCVVIFWIGSGVVLKLIYTTDAAGAGQFGDMFGAINALFSGLTIVGLIYTILLQRKEIHDAKEEFTQQKITADLQRFESRFFEMLKAQREIVSEIDLKRTQINKKTKLRSETSTNGRGCFKIFYKQHFEQFIIDSITKKHGGFEAKLDENDKPIGNYLKGYLTLPELTLAYEKFFAKHQADLSHYFRHLYHLILMVHEADYLFNTDEKKYQYAKLIKAQLSTYETLLLFYNGLSKYAVRNLKPLLERYIFFKNMDASLLINGEDDKNAKDSYAPTAYGSGW